MTPPDIRASTPRCILHWATHAPHAIAVAEGSRAYTYHDLATGIAQYVVALRASGVRPGMLVGMECDNRYLHLLLIFACEIVGAASISLSPGDVMDGEDILPRCRFLCTRQTRPPLPDGTGWLHLTQETIDRIARIPVSPDRLAALDMQRADDDLLRVSRTSGSTGRPKFMPMTQRVIEQQVARTIAERVVPGIRHDCINLYNFVPHWVHVGCSVAFRTGRTVVSAGFETVFSDLDRYPGANISLLSGDAARLLAACPRDGRGPRPCLLNVKGGAMTATVYGALQRDVVTCLHHTYGITETFRVAVLDDAGIGQVCPEVSVRIVDDAGQAIPLGQTGVIEVRTPSMIDGYLWDDAATRRSFIDGWYRTSDVGHFVAPNRLMLLGRLDDMVNIGGVKIAPRPLEERIAMIAGVAEAILVVVPDANGIDGLNVVMALHDGADVRSIHDRIGPIVAPHVRAFVPRYVDSLPRTENGKLRRGEVRRMILALDPASA